MASAKAALTGRVLDFYRQFAPQDIAKATIALSMNIPPKELFAMLAEKYNIDQAKVRSRLELYDTVEEYFRRHCPAEMAQVEVAMKMQCEPDELLKRVRVLVSKAARKSPTSVRAPHADPHRTSPRRLASSSQSARLSARSLLPPPPPEPEIFSPLAVAPVPQPSVAHAISMTSGVALNDSGVQASSPTPEEKSTALIAREEALNARSLALATLNPGVQIVATAVEDRHIENFYRRLVLIEGELFAKLVALEQHEEIQTKERIQLEERTRQREAAEKIQQQADVRFQQTQHERDVENVRKQTQLDAKLKELTDREARVAERERTAEYKQSQLEAKERQCAQQQQELVVEKHNVASQVKLIEQERELCKRLSGEVLKREATVRQVEKALLQAKMDVDRLEQDLAARAKTLMADEAAVKKWAVDLERREMTLQSVIEQLQLKGIQVSVQ
jgi:hypothetical protein